MSSSTDPPGSPGPDPAGGQPTAGEPLPKVPGPEWVKGQREDADAAGAGLQFGLTICVFALLGLWLDGRFGTAPWLLVTGVVLSVVGGTVSLIKKYS